MCNPNTLVLHKAKGSIWRRCPALGAIHWRLWNFVSNHLSLFLLTLWKWLQLIWPRVILSQLKKFTPLLPHLLKTLYLINHSLHVFYVEGCCDVSSRSLFWMEALSPLAARSAGLSQLLVASLFGSFGLKGAAHSPKVKLSPACRRQGSSVCIQWLGCKGLDNVCQYGATLKIHPRSRACHRIGKAPLEKFCMSDLVLGDAVTELSLGGARWHCLTIWNKVSAITVMNSRVGQVVRGAWTWESYGNCY